MGVNGFQAAAPGFWRSVTGRGSHPTGSVTGCAARHEAQHSPRLRLAPACSQPRPRPGVAELGVVRRLLTIGAQRSHSFALEPVKPIARVHLPLLWYDRKSVV